MGIPKYDITDAGVQELLKGPVKIIYEKNDDTNPFSDAHKTKLDGVETGATADQTDAEILAAANSASGRDMVADGSKLDGIEAGATADQTYAEILNAVQTASGRNIANDGAKLSGIEAGADVTKPENIASSVGAAGSRETLQSFYYFAAVDSETGEVLVKIPWAAVEENIMAQVETRLDKLAASGVMLGGFTI